MDKKLLKDILAAHADRLVSGAVDNAEELDLTDAEELMSLLDVAQQIKSTLQPVTPTRSFETELKRELLTTAHLRQVEGYTPPNPSRDLLILAALMTLFVSIISWFLARRLRSQTI